jgi:hypothetical protein
MFLWYQFFIWYQKVAKVLQYLVLVLSFFPHIGQSVPIVLSHQTGVRIPVALPLLIFTFFPRKINGLGISAIQPPCRIFNAFQWFLLRIATWGEVCSYLN